MSTFVFALIAIVAVGYMGASASRKPPRVWGLAFLVYSCGFISACAAIGYIAGINPLKLMTGCGLLIVVTLAVAALFSKPER